MDISDISVVTPQKNKQTNKKKKKNTWIMYSRCKHRHGCLFATLSCTNEFELHYADTQKIQIWISLCSPFPFAVAERKLQFFFCCPKGYLEMENNDTDWAIGWKDEGAFCRFGEYLFFFFWSRGTVTIAVRNEVEWEEFCKRNFLFSLWTQSILHCQC